DERVMHAWLELHLTYTRRLGGHRVASGLPGMKTAVQNVHVGMAEVFQQPKTTGRTHTGDALVEDDRFFQIDATLLEQMLDHPHERGQRLGAGIVQRDAIEVEMHCAWYPALGIGGCSAHVNDRQVGITEPV